MDRRGFAGGAPAALAPAVLIHPILRPDISISASNDTLRVMRLWPNSPSIRFVPLSMQGWRKLSRVWIMYCEVRTGLLKTRHNDTGREDRNPYRRFGMRIRKS